MNTQIKADWLKLLGCHVPSNNGHLATRPADGSALTRYSGLGLLCDLAAQSGIVLVKQEWPSFHLSGLIEVSYDGEHIALPTAVAHWAGIDPLPWVMRQRVSEIQNLAYISGRQQDGSFREFIELIELFF